MSFGPFGKPLDPGFTQAPPGNRPSDGKIYVGIVKNNTDIQRMGRLEVWIPEMGGDPADSSKWVICRYASPFAGATDVNQNTKDGQNLEGTQTSYGMWFVPPDLENQVLVVFAGGAATSAYWFACVWQQNMTHMVPGVASAQSFEPGGDGMLPPVAEYNKKTSNAAFDPQNTKRPRFTPLHDGLTSQGLYTDKERGPSSSSSRREAPSAVFGILSPRANSIHFDDDTSNEFIRLRTRGGTQVLIHETNGYVYINSKKGNSWIEVSDTGVDIYSKGNISARTEQDFNIRADKNINLDAGQNINMKSGQMTKINSGSDMHIKSNTNLFLEATATQHHRGETIRSSAQTLDSRGRYVNRDGLIYDNDGRSTAADFAKTPDLVSQTDVDKSSVKTPVSRMPTHEPWPGHPKSSQSTPSRGDVSGGSTGISGASSPGNLGGGKATTSIPNTTTQTTGDGKKVKTGDTSGTKAVTGKASPEVEAAIRKAASKTGVDYGFMMAMAQTESNFNPNAKAGTSSATGLYQFTDSTWSSMVKKYGAANGISDTQADKLDPEKNALMGAYFAKENQAYIEKRTGEKADNTDLYMGHFLGAGGASTFLRSDPNAAATSVVSSAAASANKNIFYNKDGSSRTVQEVKDLFAKKIEPKAAAYNKDA